MNLFGAFVEKQILTTQLPAMNFSAPLRSQWHSLGQVRANINPASKILKGSRTSFSVKAPIYNVNSESKQRLVNGTTSPDELLGSIAALNMLEDSPEDIPRLPRSVQAIYLRPLRREAQYGVPSCDLQMRSYSVRNLEFFADFALRAAYYLKLPAFGPIPLPRITERWTVPKSNFIYKKAQENFQRITLRRLIQIKDGHPETVELWLAFLKKHAYYGIGMKANVWEYNELGVGKTMDVSMENLRTVMEPQWSQFGRKKTSQTAKKVMELMNSEKFRLAAGGDAPMMKP